MPHAYFASSNDKSVSESCRKGIPVAVPRKEYTQEQIREIFKRHDANGDGRLSKAEIQKAFDQLGACIPIYRAYRGLNHADGNGDGFIDMNELEDLVSYAKKLGYNVR